MDSLIVSASQDAGGYAIFRENNLEFAFGLPIEWVILHWYACGADGRSGGRSVYGHVITKFSRMGSLTHVLTHGARLRALRVRELGYE